MSLADRNGDSARDATAVGEPAAASVRPTTASAASAGATTPSAGATTPSAGATTPSVASAGPATTHGQGTAGAAHAGPNSADGAAGPAQESPSPDATASTGEAESARFDDAPFPVVAPGHHRDARWSTGRQLIDGWRALPLWSQVLAVYVLSRWLDFLIITRVARFQVPSLWTAPNPGYLGMISLWDGDWYRKIAETGYPTHLPIDSAGHVGQNEWAFYPLYPYTVRAVMRLLGTGWPVSATLVSMLCGALAVVVLGSLIEGVAGRSVALWTVVLFCTFPSAPVLQLAYTEAISMLVLVCVLWCLQRRQYLLAVPLVLMLGLARPIAVPMAAVIALHVLSRLWRHRRDPVRAGGLVAMGLLLVASVVAAVEWTLIVGAVTGDPNGYTDTMAAWRVGHTITILKPWWTMSRYFLGDWVGPMVVALVVLVAGWWLTRPQARVVAGDLRVWTVCYLGYLGVVLDPSTSLTRYLLLLFPFGTMFVAASPSKAHRWTLAVAFLAGQVLWVAWLWRFSPPTDWPP